MAGRNLNLKICKKKKILFIEDEPDQVLMVRLRLEKSGYYVITAMDGVAGLKKALQEKPDLILLDVIMPGIDGLEVCRRLRAESTMEKVPVIVTTAAGSDDIEHACATAGADDCIRKPYEASGLIDKVRRLIGE